MKRIERPRMTSYLGSTLLAAPPVDARQVFRKHLLVSAGSIFIAAVAGAAHSQALPPPATAAQSTQLQEVVVTAEKKGAESLLKTPVPVGVINTDALATREQVRLQDYFEQVPGFMAAPSAVGQSNIAIRGINTVGTPTVGVMIDDVPFGSSTDSYVPDLDPADLARIEVLRGPQGTLFGSDSMGGLIRFVTVAPSTQGFSGQVSAGVTSVSHGDGLGFSVRGSVNLPVSSTFAIRASAFARQEPGYIYDTLTNQKGSNPSRANGGRVAALWRPSDKFSVLLSGTFQTLEYPDEGDDVLLNLGDLQSSFVKDGTGSKSTIQNYSAIINGDFGRIHLTSLTGYNTLRVQGHRDFTNVMGPRVQRFFGVAPYARLTVPIDNDKFSQEVRASTSIGEALDLTVGGFYTHEKKLSGGYIVGIDPLTGQQTTPTQGFFYHSDPYTLDEYAAFGDATWRIIPDRFDVQVGARISHIDQKFGAVARVGVLNRVNPTLIPASEARASPFTYLVTPRFYLTPDIMIYARGASGYRPGGTNTVAGVPPQFTPDQTYTYEVGLKGKFLENRLTADVSVYHVDWKNIQVLLATPDGMRYNGNGGTAKSEGAELTVTARPFRGMSISGWVDYDNAALTSAFPNSPIYGVPGSRLPFAPKYSGDISVRQDFPVAGDLTAFVGGDVSYTGDRVGDFQEDPVRQVYPSFTQVNLQAGIVYNQWSANVFVNNLGDVRGQLNGGIGYPGFDNEFVLIQPRTVGVSVTAKFK